MRPASLEAAVPGPHLFTAQRRQRPQPGPKERQCDQEHTGDRDAQRSYGQELTTNDPDQPLVAVRVSNSTIRPRILGKDFQGDRKIRKVPAFVADYLIGFVAFAGDEDDIIRARFLYRPGDRRRAIFE